MGGLWSRLRAKPSTKELLEDLEKEIEQHEEYKRSTEQQHKKVIGSLIFYFILLFIIVAVTFMFYYFPHLKSTKEIMLYSIPLFLIPLMCVIFKRVLHWYFCQKLKMNEENLTSLKKRRRSLLDFAMETETYKVVKDLLEKYDPQYHKKVFEPLAIEAAPTSQKSTFQGSFGETELRRRSTPTKAAAPTSPTPSIVSPGQTISISRSMPTSPVLANFTFKSPTNPPFPPAYLQKNSQQINVRVPVQQMTRPVLPRDRTLVDRLVDYLVGDGPSNRFALICRQCQSHNGMALREEFEFIAFRCCYCFHWNPPRNQQPLPPRLPLPAPNPMPTITEPPPSQEGSLCGDTEVEQLLENVQEEDCAKENEDIDQVNLQHSDSLNTSANENGNSDATNTVT